MRNHLLDALPRELYQSLEPRFERLALKRGVVLHEPGHTIRHLYFPLTCLVSITVTARDGKTVDTGVVGNREMVGVNAFMGGSETTQTRYNIQIPGDAMKIPSEPAMIAQISQNVACNRLHDVRQRYARWLLEVRDRIESEDLPPPREFAAEMLGVRLATVSETSSRLEEEGLLTISRGLTRILDSAGLERAACECYSVVKEEHDRLLGQLPSR